METEGNQPPESEDGTDDELASLFAADPNLHRMIVVWPGGGDQTSYLDALYAARALPTPSVLAEWETRVDRWCADYREAWDESALLEVKLDSAVYVWDQNHERVVVAYGREENWTSISSPTAGTSTVVGRPRERCSDGWRQKPPRCRGHSCFTAASTTTTPGSRRPSSSECSGLPPLGGSSSSRTSPDIRP